ncbi:TatD family hydrolase [Candidatus Gottesmanbacteria bacterium]|nr:TatD family hydrolase [Candidatus Gottesmanbacteria bacterium]
MFIDTHCHLNFPQYDEDRAMVIGNAKKAGVHKFINPGVDWISSTQAVALAQQHPRIIYAGIGFHPYEAQKDPETDKLAKLYQDHKNHIVAIGEIGLDYHQYKEEKAEGKKQNQKILFEEQLRFALAHNLPVIMHCRDAYEDFFDILDSLPSMPRGVIHCFSGGLQELRMAQKRNFFVGIDGNITYSKQLELTVPHIPLPMLLLETDAPFLTPTPHRGTRNDPKYIPLIAKKAANLLNVSVNEIEEITTVNAKKLFSVLI